jgi:hypothetical protein
VPARPCFSALLLGFLIQGPLAAQAPTSVGQPSSTYLERFQALWDVEPSDLSAPVKDLVLKRDVGVITLLEGTLVLLQPLGGQVLGAVFEGRGRFHLTPPSAIEQERTNLVRGSSEFDVRFDRVVFLFADGTYSELRQRLRFGPGRIPDNIRDDVRKCLDRLGDPGHQWIDADVLRPVLNGEQTGLFYAHFAEGGDGLMFMINPHEVEGVRVLVTKSRGGFLGKRFAEVLTQFPPEGQPPQMQEARERHPEAGIRKYTMEVRLPQGGSGDLNFAATAELEIVADTGVGPWVSFLLYEKMEVDSARWADGSPAEVFLGKESPYLWVRLDRRLEKGETRTLRLAYHGDLLDRFGDWFYIKSSVNWYPLSQDVRAPALFDLTFLSPTGFLLAAVGDRTDSAPAPGHMVRTRWVTPQPIRNASFNIGLFEEHTVSAPDLPPITVLWSDDMHRRFVTAMAKLQAGDERGQIVLSGKNMKGQVGDDVANALRFFHQMYGKLPLNRFYATEIPWDHGEAWPGIIGLSWITFQRTDDQGFDEVFRAHEVAHQWWGISVDYATYHDRWLSEGLSEFSGLWYLQTRRKDNKKYFAQLDRWKADIMLRRDDPLPIWLGHRVISRRASDDYRAIVYEKGAWILHMLRVLLLDMKTLSEDRFTEIMRDFYRSHAGGRASTTDLQRLIENRTGQPMDWFFSQWVFGSAIPTYKVAWRTEEAGVSWRVKLRVDQERVPPDFVMYVPVLLDLGNGQAIRVRVKVTGSRSEIELPLLPAKPKALKFNDLQGVLAEVKETSW